MVQRTVYCFMLQILVFAGNTCAYIWRSLCAVLSKFLCIILLHLNISVVTA